MPKKIWKQFYAFGGLLSICSDEMLENLSAAVAITTNGVSRFQSVWQFLRFNFHAALVNLLLFFEPVAQAANYSSAEKQLNEWIIE